MLDGVVEYALGGVVQGWVKASLPGVACRVFLRGAKFSDPLLADLVARSEGGGQVLSFKIVAGTVGIGELVSGEVEIVAACDGYERVLPLWHVLKLAHEMAKLTDRQRESLEFWRKAADVKQFDDGTSIAPLCGFGAASFDGDAVIGRNGHLFLGAGSNKVSELYQRDYPGKATQWANLFRARLDALNEVGIPFRQIVIPEKSSVLPQLCPFPASRPSSVFMELQEEVSRAGVSDRVLFPFLDRPVGDSDDFARVDSHLSTAGCRRLLAEVIEACGLSCPRLVETSKRILLKGDLGGKFHGDWKESVEVAQSLSCGNSVLVPTLVREGNPVGGGHKGIERIWICDDAPIKLRVVAFANSFFERGVLSTQLSWWFARIFKEFHFIWSPALPMAYVKQVRPDLVVCQTIERFLRVVPES